MQDHRNMSHSDFLADLAARVEAGTATACEAAYYTETVAR